MRRFPVVLAVALCALSIQPASHAARDGLGQGLQQDARMELLIFERESCVYCELFRRDVAPRYRSAPASAKAPLRFVDIDRADIGALGLKGRLTMLPTAVLMKNGAEVDRIVGYTGPETFFQLVPVLLERAGQ
jgi:thioredoxin-related protein